MYIDLQQNLTHFTTAVMNTAVAHCMTTYAAVLMQQPVSSHPAGLPTCLLDLSSCQI